MKGDASSGQFGISAEQLSLILATCAILISGASFYATYLQAESAEKQVKAMTLPLIQFTHGNYDDNNKQHRISFNLKNAGVGPAIVKKVAFLYKDVTYGSLPEFFGACCGTEWEKYREVLRDVDAASKSGSFSSPLLDVVIPGQTDYDFQVIEKNDASNEFWFKLNDERWRLELRICYCSLLDECFVTEKSGVFDRIEKCPED